MRFLVVERVKTGIWPVDESQSMKMALADGEYKMNLKKGKKIVGGGPSWTS